MSLDQQNALKTMTLGELLAKDIAPREPMLGPWLHQRHINMTYAPTGVGKSMLSLAVALAVAGGGKFLDWKAPKARKVLLVDSEMDEADLQTRATKMLPTMAEIDREAAAANLRILARQAQGAGVKFPDLADAEGRAEVLKKAAAHKAELVILDNFSTLTTVDDENAASSFNPVIELMQEMKQAGMACMLVHHSRKGASGEGSYRGTSKMAVVFNSVLALGHPGGVPSSDFTAFDMRWEKFRGRRDDTMRTLKVTLDLDGGTGWGWEVSESDQLSRMLDALRTAEYPTQAALAVALKVTPGTLSKWKARAMNLKMISDAEWNQCLARSAELKQPLSTDY